LIYRECGSIVDEDVVALGSTETEILLIIRPLEERPREDDAGTLMGGRKALLAFTSKDIEDPQRVLAFTHSSFITCIGHNVTEIKSFDSNNK
jgi:hypothetical protein